MNYKEILKISAIVAVAITILGYLVDLIGPIPELEAQLYMGLLVGGLLATYSVLNRKLKKEDWGAAVGILATYVVYVILVLLLDLAGL